MLRLLRDMLKIRRFEEKVSELFKQGLLAGPYHLYIGQEAVAVGSCASLRPDDHITSTHRGHGHVIARHGPLNRMMAELFGKATGSNKGKGGSLHLAFTELGILGANGIVGAGIPIATGAGLASKLMGWDRVTLCFFGDGATNQGTFHEGINLASALDLSTVYICENNLYGVGTAQAKVRKVKDLAERARSYAIPGISVDGNDVLAVYRTVKDAVERARRGLGPSLIVCDTYRWHTHFEGEPDTYRDLREVEEWKAKDPISRFRKKLVEGGVLTLDEAQRIEEEVKAEVEEAVSFAQESPEPGLEEALTDVYASAAPVADVSVQVETSEERRTREVTFREALCEAISEEMRRDDRVFVLGLDVGPYGGAFGATKGLWKEFPDRVLDMPISEAGYVGAAVGAAMVGMKPVAELQFSDWITIASDQLVNQAAKIRYMFGGNTHVPMVLRAPVGGYISAAAQHSQMFESWLAFVPGLKVVLPSTPYDAKGLLKSAIRDPDPVIFFEHKKLYEVKGPVPEGEYTVPLGRAQVKMEGGDVTLVAYSYMVTKALQAAAILREKGVTCEVLDLRTIKPLDKDAILRSVKKTSRLVVVQETQRFCGVAAEVSATVAEEGFDLVKAPIRRVTAKEAPIPFSPKLEKYVLPQVEDIVETVRETVG